MDTKKLEALVSSVELGSFTRAAQVLGYTQSGLTHMMNSLEKDIGFPVLVRGRGGVSLTPQGQRIFPMVRHCLEAGTTLEREIHLVNTHQDESIRVAAYASIAMHWLPELIEQFRHRHEGVGVDVQMGSVEEVYRWVREGKVDMSFASYQDGMGLEWTKLRDDPLLAILPPGEDLSGAETFDVRQFDGREFLMPSMGFDLDIMRVLNLQDIHPVIKNMQVSDSVVISMVEHGLGVSMLSELVLRGRRDRVLALPMEPPAARELGIATLPRRELRSVARQFIAAAEKIVATL